MKPAPFDFYAPDTEEQVRELLAEHGEDARLLAGGQSLVPLMNMRILQPAVIISLNRCSALAYLREEGDFIVCGALTRQACAEDSALVGRHVPLLAAALPHVGVQANRNVGTVCGSLAHADPLAELPSVATALDATFVIASGDHTREVAAGEFFVAALTTCIEPGEMLREVRFPKTPAHAHSVFLEVANRAHGFAVAGLAAYVEVDPNSGCASARFAAMGMGSTAARLVDAEAAIAGRMLDERSIEEAASAASRCVEPDGDLHASADYRRHLAGVLVRRALNRVAGSQSQ